MSVAKTSCEENDPRPRMLFVRNYRKFTGGHLKYAHYLSHVAAHGKFRPILHVTGDSVPLGFDELVPPHIERVGLPHPCEAVFVAGRDWDILDAAGQALDGKAVINLVQHVRHADPAQPLHRHLSRVALRICVSRQVADAIAATGRVEGPIHVVENCLDMDELAGLRQDTRTGGILVAGIKDKALAREVGALLDARGVSHDVLTDPLPRADFLGRLASCDHAVLLPRPTEGFFLPALEAMALGVTVIMPDCVGARGFARDGETCVVAPRHPHALAQSVVALAADPGRIARLRAGALAECRAHDIAGERRAFHAILDEVLP